jgi:hypothetical protein
MVPPIRNPRRSSVRRFFKHDNGAPTAVGSLTEDSSGHHSGRDLVLLVEPETYQVLRKLRGYNYQQRSVFTDEILPEVRCRACCRGEVPNPRPKKLTTGDCSGIPLYLSQAKPCVLWSLERSPQKAKICMDRHGRRYAGGAVGLALGFPHLFCFEIRCAGRRRGNHGHDRLVDCTTSIQPLALSPLSSTVLLFLVGFLAICGQMSPLWLGEICSMRPIRTTMGIRDADFRKRISSAGQIYLGETESLTNHLSPPTSTTSFATSFRRLLVSTSPFTLTSPLWIITFACPPDSAIEVSFRN